MSTVTALQAVVARELRKTVRDQGEAVNALIFFLLAVILFPFALGPDPELLRAVAAGVIWVAALLAASFSLDGLFRNDFADGSLELLALSGVPLALIGLGKSCAHWLISALPLVVLSAPLGIAMDLDSATVATLAASLTLGTACMSLLGAAISALTVGLRGSGMLLALLILPLYIPLLIFGASASANTALGLEASAELLFLAGLLVLALTLAPWATAAALKIRLA